MDLIQRKRNLELVCEGSNTDYLQDNVQTDLLLALSDHQSNRVERALKNKMVVAPIANSIYKVISINESKDNSIYQTNTRVDSCTCSDFLYRCDYENGERCKHLWRIQFLTNLNALPQSKQNPTRWIFTELQKDKLIAKSKGYTTISNRLEKLQYELMNYNPRGKQTLRRFFVEWLAVIRSQQK